MIRKFISKGILGIPDMEVEFNDEKIIIIKGPNGSGKSSLLRQITHPFSSHNRFNRLKPGIDEGYTIMYIRVRNTDYKVQHLYNRKKNRVEVLSYIAKMVNGQYEELCDTGLASKFKDIVRYELEYDSYMYPILNIGIENRGIVDGTNIDRIEYFKKILKLEVLNSIKENVLANLKDSKANFKYVENKIKEYSPIKDMVADMEKAKSDTMLINSRIEKNTSLLSEINVRDDEYDNLNRDLSDINDNLEDLNKINDILKKDKYDISYDDYINNIKNDINTYKIEISHISTEMDHINEELVSIKEIDNEKLLKEKNELISTIKKIKDKYQNKKFKDIPIDIVITIKSYLDNLKSIIANSNLEILDIKKYMKEYKDINKLEEDHKSKVDKIKDEIAINTNKMESISISHSLLDIEAKEEDCLPTCPFRHEYNRQLQNLDLYNLLKEKIDKLNNNLSDLEEKYPDIKDAITTISLIRSTKFPKEIELFYKGELINLIDINVIEDIYNELLNLEFYIKDMNDITNYENKLDKVVALLELEDKNAKEKKANLLKDLEKYNNTINENNKHIEDLNIKLSKAKIDIYNFNNSHITFNNISSKINTLEEDKKNILSKINNIKNTITRKKDIEKEIESLKVELQLITDKYYKLKNDLTESNKLTKEFEEMSQNVEKLNILQKVVSTRLPARILESFLHEIANQVNILLDDFMTIRFNVEEGVDIYINRDGIERLASELSQGEKSMLSMALLIALKKNIPWDIISFDEIDATLDENNKSKFIYMVRDYSDIVSNLSQIFIVTHTDFHDDGIDVKIINL